MTERRLAPAAEVALREAAPRVLAAVVRRAGDFAAAEDAVQEAVLDALVAWPRDGVPANPAGWLYRVARRRAADRGDAEEARRRREREIAERGAGVAPPPEADDDALTSGPDDSLLLFVLCCHPSLTPPSAIALTLRAVGGLTTAEIARAFLVPEETMAQRISRAKRTIKEAGADFARPGTEEIVRRLDAVRHALYLIFNEGYAGSAGEDLLRVDLSTEAIRLARALRAARPRDPAVAGLLALMLLTDARRAARTGPDGELTPLDEQDRGLWDRALIAEGSALAGEAWASGTPDGYAIQAAIAALHDDAASTDATDWPQILALYGLLRAGDDNPLLALNETVAFAMVRGPVAGLARLESVAADPRLATSFRTAAVRAHLRERAGDRDGAVAAYRDAATRATNLAERRFLIGRAARLAPPSPPAESRP